jgi:hypothetical protein
LNIYFITTKVSIFVECSVVSYKGKEEKENEILM